MLDLSVIILTKNEELHIGRCLEKLRDLNLRQVFVVDCFSTDGSDKLAKAHGAEVIYHEWPGNQAKQFNWALDNLPIKASWVLRLDADEYLYPDTIEEVKSLLPKWDGEEVTGGGLPPDVTSLSLSRARRYLQMDIRFGGREVELVRFFKVGFGRSAQSEMDEHIVTSGGRNVKLKGRFVDDSLITFDQWHQKHLNYAEREARMAVAGAENGNKRLYYRLPPYFRALAYFCYRYFMLLGFLDGIAGWRWNYWQGLWYRWIVDRRIVAMKRELKSKKRKP